MARDTQIHHADDAADAGGAATGETFISPHAVIEPGAAIGRGCTIGPFCLVGPDVTLGDGCTLDSHVVLTGQTTIGRGNRFFPQCVIGGEPQDKAFDAAADVRVEIGDGNQFRENVTVHRGAPKEDGITRVGDRNLVMAGAHIAHNCHVHSDTILVNGVLLGGHVHIHDRAIVSGNSVVHHFSTIGTMAFVSGGCRVPHDIPPYMLAAGSDNPSIRTINMVGMRRAGIARETIALVKKAYKRIFRDHQPAGQLRDEFAADCDGVLPLELMNLLSFVEAQGRGRMGRQREGVAAAAVTTKKAA